MYVCTSALSALGVYDMQMTRQFKGGVIQVDLGVLDDSIHSRFEEPEMQEHGLQRRKQKIVGHPL